MSVCLFVCLSVRERNSNNIAAIQSIVSTQEGVYPWFGPPLRLSRPGSGIELKNDSSSLIDRN